jgi:hypothetical protein
VLAKNKPIHTIHIGKGLRYRPSHKGGHVWVLALKLEEIVCC